MRKVPFFDFQAKSSQRVRLDEIGAIDLADVVHGKHGLTRDEK